MTVCENCGERLDNLKEIVAIEGMLCCSRTCAISHLAYHFKTNAFELAKEKYEAMAETISPKDAGIMPDHFNHLIEFVQYSQGCSEDLACKVAMEIADELEELIEERLEELQDEQSR